MKVAYLFSRYPVPSQTFCDTEMRALEAAGFEVEIYSCSPPTSAFRHGVDERPRGPVFHAPPGTGLEWHEIAARHAGRWPADMVADHGARFGARHGSTDKAILETARRAQHAVYFADLLRRRGIEHLHVHFANRATHAALFIHALTGPAVFVHGARAGFPHGPAQRRPARRNVRALRIRRGRERLEPPRPDRRCPDAAAKIHRVHNGLPLERWPEPVRGGSASASPVADLQRGTVGGVQGFADLIAACAELRARGVAFQCEIAGEGPEGSALGQQIELLGISDGVRLLGLLPQAEIRVRLSACDVFALACRVDEKGACACCPTVILEAMAAARPVVSTRLAAVPEMVDDGQTGRLVTPGDVPALADALEALSRDPALRETARPGWPP